MDKAFLKNLFTSGEAALQTLKGKVYGKISFPPRGNNGFGYDPIFIPNGYKITFGEMDPSEKHSISHRANAFNLLKLELLNDR